MTKHNKKSKKVIFALTSRGADFFSCMTRVAVASLRVSNPELQVVVACDKESDKRISLSEEPLIREVDKWLVVETPPGSDGFRNRYVKTKLRSLLDGPFLFLDSDIFACGDLSEIFTFDCDIAGARNHSCELFSEQVWDQDYAALKEMGWEIGNHVYINGGVLFFNDTDSAHCLAAEWHRRWLQSATDRNCFRDQPALNSALYFVQPEFIVLSDRYNAQIWANPSAAVGAFLWHYYAAVNRRAMTGFDVLVDKVIGGGDIDFSEIRQLIACDHPWTRKNIMDDWAIKHLIRRGAYSGWEAAWLQRKMRRYLIGKIGKLTSRAKV